MANTTNFPTQSYQTNTVHHILKSSPNTGLSEGTTNTTSNNNNNNNHISLSLEATSLKALNQSNKLVTDRSKIYGENGLFLTLQGQVTEFGAEADMLKTMPSSTSSARLDLANQAIDFALGKGQNPFKNIDRETLSRIGLDDSGAFTPAERFAAIYEMSDRDNEFANSVFDAQQNARSSSDERGARLIQVDAQLERAKGMTKEEQLMMGVSIGALNAERANLVKDAATANTSIKYENLTSSPNSLLSATNSEGKVSWIKISLNDLNSESAKIFSNEN